MGRHAEFRHRLARLGLAAMVALATCAALPLETLAQGTAEPARQFDLHIANGRLANSPQTIRVRGGDSVELAWSADRRSVVHLHGYDIELAIEPGKPQIMKFRAHATGRFPIELHGAGHTVLVYLEVHPR